MGCLLIFGIPFFLFGAIGLYFVGIRPISQTLDARQWVETPAEVVKSEVQSRRDSDGGTTYRAHIEYSYEWEGRTYQSDRHRFSKVWTSPARGPRQTVQQYPVGHQFTAYVNPQNPEEAVIDRSLQWITFLFIGLTGLFCVIGAGIFIFALRRIIKGRSQDSSSSYDLESQPIAADRYAPGTIPEPRPAGADGRVFLPSDISRWGKVIGTLAITLFWNGIVSVFLFQAFASLGDGDPEYFLFLFLIPFVLIGLFLIGAFFYSFLGAFNPRVELWIRPGRARPGRPFTLGWSFTGPVGRLTDFTIRLEGREEVHYRQGTRNVVEDHCFYNQDLVHLEDSMSISSGQTEVALPPEAIHSLCAPNNRIIWQFVIHGRIKKWPDILTQHPFTLLPQENK